MNELAIKQLVASKGWVEVLNVFNEEILENKLPKNFATKGKTAEIIALECMAREMASNMVDKCIKKIERVANKQELKKESWA